MRKPRTHFEESVKRSAVEEFVSGRKTAQEVADGLGVERAVIYKWRVQLSERDKGARVEELESMGHSKSEARKIQSLEAELEEYYLPDRKLACLKPQYLEWRGAAFFDLR